VHLQNYINIAKKNPGCRFTLWTKNYKVALDYFTKNDCPENFTLIISSLFVNKRQDLAPFKKLGKFKKGQLKVFTVYDYDYIKANYDTLKINCGSRLCVGCRLCYDKNEVEEINEILKSDQERAERFLNSMKPDYNDKMAKAIDEIGDLEELFSEGEDEESSLSLDINNEEEVESNEDKNTVVTDGDYNSGCAHHCGGCPYAGMCGGGIGDYEGANDEVLNQVIREKKIDNLVKIIGDRLKDMDSSQADVTMTFLTEFAKKLYETEDIKDGE
jgi:ferredoxin